MPFISYQIEGTLTSTIPRSQPGFISTSLPHHEEEISSSVLNDDHAATVAKPPRPPNAWILYRSETIRKLKEANSPLLETSQSELSKKIAEQWKNETPETKKWFERDAEIKKLEHAKMHPGYVFKPKRSGKSRSPGKSKSSISPSTVPSPLGQEYQLPMPHPHSQYVQLQRSPYSGEYHGSYESEEEERSNSAEFGSEGFDRSRPYWDKESSIAQYSYGPQMPLSHITVPSSPEYDHYRNSHGVQNSYETPRAYEAYGVNGNDGYHITNAHRNHNSHDPYPSQRSNNSYPNDNFFYYRPGENPLNSMTQQEYMPFPSQPDYHLTSNGPIHHNSREFNDMNNSYQFPPRQY